MWKASRALYEQNRQAFEKGNAYASDQPALFVFVTLGMPEQTLRLLIDQASRTQAIMVLRGLENASIRQTAAHVQQLIGQKPSPVADRPAGL